MREGRENVKYKNMRKVSAKENDKRGGKLRKTKWNLTEDRKKV